MKLFERFISLTIFVCSLLSSAAVLANDNPSSSLVNYVSSIDYRRGKVIVKLNTKTDLKYSYNLLRDGRFYLDLHKSIVPKNYKWNIDDKYIKYIRYAQNEDNKVRVVLDLKSKRYKPVIEKHPSKIIIDLVNRIPIKKSSSISSKKTVKKTPAKKKIRIMIDPGHGGKDPGTIGPKGTKEKNLTLDISKKLYSLLKSNPDFEVKLTRNKDKYIALSKRKDMARKWNTDIFISIHLNGNDEKWLNDTEIYYHDKKSYKLAKAVRNELIDELNRRTGKIKKKPYTVIYNNTAKYGSVLVESCYLTSARGEQRLRKDSYRMHIAQGIYDSINSYAKKL